VLDQKIQDLSGRAANATDATKTDLQTKLEELRAKRAVLGQKLDDVKNATEANWDDAKNAFHNGYEDVRTSLHDAWHTLTGN
jgi:predicted nucleic acid-binding protein